MRVRVRAPGHRPRRRRPRTLASATASPRSGAHERLIAALGPAMAGLGIELGAVHTEPGHGPASSSTWPPAGDSRRPIRRSWRSSASRTSRRASACGPASWPSPYPTRRARAATCTSRCGAERTRRSRHRTGRRPAGAAVRCCDRRGPRPPARGLAAAQSRRSTPTSGSSRAGSRPSTRAGVRRTAPAPSGRSAPSIRSDAASNAGVPAPTRIHTSPSRRSSPRRPRGSGASPTCRDPIVGDASEQEGPEPLPRSLEAALEAFERDQQFTAMLGAEFSRYYATSRRWELAAWQQAVSDWERERYGRAV